jgi:hypothetical protein
MKKIISSLFLLAAFTQAKSQEIKCPVVQDTFCLVRMSAWPRDGYPIFMDGLSKGFDCQKLDLTNTDSLFNSFYRQATFMPQFPNSIAAGLTACMGDSAGRKYYADHYVHFSEQISKIKKYSVEKKLKLSDGSSLIINSVSIFGDFYVVDKKSTAIVSNSNQIDIKDIYTIERCFIPSSLIVIGPKNKRR